MTALGNLTTTGGGLTQLNGSVTTAGFQNLADNIQLLNNATLTATSGNVSFGGTLDGTKVLNIVAGGAGQVVFTGQVGNATPLASLNIASATAVDALSTLEIDGSSVALDGLRIGAGVNNVNIAQAGSSITAANAAGIQFSGGSTNSTISGFKIENTVGKGLSIASGDYSGTTISGLEIVAGKYGVYVSNAENITLGGTASEAALNVNGATYGIFATGQLGGSSVRGSSFSNGTYGGLLSTAQGLTLAGNNTFGDFAIQQLIVFGDSS
ncbi:MAG: hypothetical protein EBU59_13675, partial [Planctomycetia bacterium]|nr:hypothetical protein [Planctomycetia bacterium]